MNEKMRYSKKPRSSHSARSKVAFDSTRKPAQRFHFNRRTLTGTTARSLAHHLSACVRVQTCLRANGSIISPPDFSGNKPSDRPFESPESAVDKTHKLLARKGKTILRSEYQSPCCRMDKVYKLERFCCSTEFVEGRAKNRLVFQEREKKRFFSPREHTLYSLFAKESY